jgi:uncharacterized protein YycO
MRIVVALIAALILVTVPWPTTTNANPGYSRHTIQKSAHHLKKRATRTPLPWVTGSEVTQRLNLLQRDITIDFDKKLGSRPSSWWRFEAEAEAPRVRRGWGGKSSAVGAF